MHASLFKLTPGQPYAFFADPNHDAAMFLAEQGPCQRRTFLGYRTCEQVPYLEVARATGKTHLISLASIAHVRPVALPD